MTQAIVMAPVEMQFRGKAQVDAAGKKVLDAEGKSIIVKDRANFTLQLPYLTKDGVADILASANDKAVDAVLKAVNGVIYQQAKAQVDENSELKDNTSLDLTKLSWDFISTLSTSELSGSTSPSKEVLEAMAADYVAIMPALTGCSMEAAKHVSAIIVQKVGKHKHNEKLLPQLLKRLGQWFEATEKQEEFAEATEWFTTRIESHIKDLAALADQI
jgi:hypothetical protein